jgi:hypothetical protein
VARGEGRGARGRRGKGMGEASRDLRVGLRFSADRKNTVPNQRNRFSFKRRIIKHPDLSLAREAFKAHELH